jgi:hypothetical protein
MPMWINRGTRRRHVDPTCRALKLSEERGAESEAAGSLVRDRIYELSDDEPTEVIEAVEEFTVPCRLCVPGARKMGELVPFFFVVEGHEEDWTIDEDEIADDYEDDVVEE